MSGLLILMGHLEQFRLLEHIADQLNTDRKPRLVKTAGNTDGRQACQVRWNGEEVGQVHRERVIGVGPIAEGGCRRRRGQQNIDGLVGRIEIPTNQGADLLGFLVVGVHVAGRQCVSADQDAPLNLAAEGFGPAAGCHDGQTLGVFGSVAVFDTVITGEIGRGFRGCDDVVRGDAIGETGAADIHQLRTQ